jgi:23S rRNA G2069 N7-methylase RlmK/C1962 C5-methylase RlmI|tara:strand:- start:3 stop:443 length:441 start_codon:yes stop_codon:yes gene_type:complete
MARDPVQKFGGVRALNNRLKGRSKVISENKEAVAAELVSMAMVNLTDIISWDEDGNVQVKPSAEISDEAIRAIKKVKITTRNFKGEGSETTLEVELYDKVRVLQILAKASGLLEPTPPETNTPSVVGITMKGPEIIEVEVEEIKGG